MHHGTRARCASSGARGLLRQLAMFRAAGLRVAGLARPLAPARQMSGHSMEHAIGARRPPRSRLASPPPARAPAPGAERRYPLPRRARRGDVAVEEVLVHVLAGRRRVRRRHDGEALHARPPRPRRGAVPVHEEARQGDAVGAQGRLQVRRRAGPAAPSDDAAPTPVEPSALAAQRAHRPPPRARLHTPPARARASLTPPAPPSRCDLFDYDCAAKERAAKKALAEAEA